MSKRAQVRMKQTIGPTGATVWKFQGVHFYWNGPGARIFLVMNGSLFTIDRPGLDHGFRSRAEARKALATRW